MRSHARPLARDRLSVGCDGVIEFRETFFYETEMKPPLLVEGIFLYRQDRVPTIVFESPLSERDTDVYLVEVKRRSCVP